MVDMKNRKYEGQGQCSNCSGPIKLGGKCCRQCRKANAKQRREAKALRKQLLSQRLCRKCGKPIGNLDPRQVYCSRGCVKLERVSVTCLVCGKTIERTTEALKRHPNACCSLECQRQHALVENHSQKDGPDWHRRSLEARKRWREQKRRQRRIAGWYGAVSRKLSDIAPNKVDGWMAAVRSRLSSHAGRVSKRPKDDKHSQSVYEAIERLDRRRSWFDRPGWYKKIANKLSNSTKRRRRKHEVKRIKGCGDTQQDRGVWSQMRFDWLADN